MKLHVIVGVLVVVCTGTANGKIYAHVKPCGRFIYNHPNGDSPDHPPPELTNAMLEGFCKGVGYKFPSAGGRWQYTPPGNGIPSEWNWTFNEVSTVAPTTGSTFLTTKSTAVTATTTHSAPCSDRLEKCPFWAKWGQCTREPWVAPMRNDCPRSCKVCKYIGEPDPIPQPKCEDTHPSCSDWVADGQCEANPAVTMWFCAKSCKNKECVGDNCKDSFDRCPFWAKHGQCSREPWTASLIRDCPRSCKVCAHNGPPDPIPVPPCKDQQKECKIWAAAGECEKNPAVMMWDCATTCNNKICNK